jgi:hypothetical protein
MCGSAAGFCIFFLKTCPYGGSAFMEQQGKEEAWGKRQLARRMPRLKVAGSVPKLRDSWVRIGNNAQFREDVAANADRLKGTESS